MSLSDETRAELRARLTSEYFCGDSKLARIILALLDGIDQLRADGIRERAMTDSAVEHMNTAAAAVDRVRALHQPYCDQGCTDTTCPITACSCGWDEYPCPTIRALDEEA